MSIEALIGKLTPPSSPVEAIGDWRIVEDALYLSLPDDFKKFITAYGSGVIGDFLTVLNPFSTRPTLNLMNQSEKQLNVLRELHDDFGEPRPYELHPSKPGLLPVAMTDNGDVIHWLTADTPEKWTIVVNAARSPDYEHFQSNFTDFILGIVDKSIRVWAFPKSLLSVDFTFRTI